MPLFGSVAYQNKGRATRPAAPGQPSIVSQSSGEVELSWVAPSFSGGAPITDYKIEYSSNNGVSWSEWSHSPSSTPSAIVDTLADYQTYIFRVSAINAVGSGNVSNNSPEAKQFNEASGGNVSTVSNYNGTGQTWKVHTFTSNGTFNSTRYIVPFRVLVVGGGGGGGGGSGQGGRGGGGGGAGGVAYNATASIPVGSRSVTVGGGGGGGSTNVPNQGPTAGGSGGGSSLSGILSAGGGGGGGADPAGCGCDQGQICCPTSPGAGTSNNITGSSVIYARSGPSGGNQCKGCTSSGPGNGGGGGSQGFGIGNYTPDSGFAGIVRVAYRIG